MVATVSANVGHYRAHNEDKSRSEKAKVLHWSRQLQMRLQYAKLKVEHGWTKQSLNEVENLYFRHSHKRGRPLQPAPTLSTTTASYSNESFTNVDTQNAPVNQSVLSFRSNLARQPTLPYMPAAGNSTVATTSSKSPSPQAISPLAPSPFPADALPTRSTPSIRVSPPPATKPQETSKPQMPWPSPTLTPKRLPPTTSKAPTSLAELFPSQTLTYDSFWSTHTSARGGFSSRGSMGNVGVMNGGLETALSQQM